MGFALAGAAFKDDHPTRAEAMELFKVPRRKVDEASRVLHTEPELFKKVHQGEITLVPLAPAQLAADADGVLLELLPLRR